MNIKCEIDEIFERHSIEPSACRAACRKLMRKLCASNGQLDPRKREHDSANAKAACNHYGYIARTFFGNGLASAATQILIDAWQDFQKIQKREGQHIYKAGIAAYLSEIYYRLGDTGAAMRWALLAHAEDALVGNHKGAARQRLQEMFGMTGPAITAFNEIAKKNRAHLNKNDDKKQENWANHYAFAESVMTRFILKHQQFATLFAHPSSVMEFPLSTSYFGTLLKRVQKTSTNDEKGKALEDLASYLFLLIPGWIPYRNVKPETNDFESDVVVRNLIPARSLTVDLFGRNFLVECKNWKDPVGAKDVGYFLYRLRLTHSNFGVIFAPKGITGDENKAAKNLINRAFHEDGSICIIIENTEKHGELKELSQGQRSFLSTLIDKAREVQYGISTYN